MKKIIEMYIFEEAKKHINKYHQYHNSLQIEYNRIQKRLKNHSEKEIKIPEYWNKDKKFNPFYVLKNRKSIANSIAKKIKEGEYIPNRPTIINKEKKGGGQRKISIFQVHDAAISNYYYKRLLSKNKHRFSSFSYAYRDDRNVHFAIQDISIELKKTSRLFVAEFDFSKFFDTINHEFLFSQFKENGFLITEEEEKIVKSFLNLQSESKGIPQGTSLSLFLANVTCWELDRMLEDIGVRFARYADDTLIWSRDYTKIVKAAEIIEVFSKKAGVNINHNKSEGISLLVPEGMSAEMLKNKNYVEFLGYKIGSKSIGIKDESIRKIKQRITSILYQNLIYPIKATNNMKETPTYRDKDYLVAICQIRKYLYGDLTEEKIKAYLTGSNKRIIFKGIMSFYLLIDDIEQMKNLDKWLCRTIVNTLKLRKKMLSNYGIVVDKFPYTLTNENLISKSSKELIKGKELFKIPSFLRINKAINKGVERCGIVKVMNPNADIYNY